MLLRGSFNTTHRGVRLATAAALAGIGLLSLANSWGSLYSAAASHLARTGMPTVTIGSGRVSLAAASLPLLLDLLIVAASSRYVLGVKDGRPVGGWRVAAHSAIAGTVIMNALAAEHLSDVPWHVIAPGVLAVVVELLAREALGQLREVRDDRGDRIPLMLWVTRPAESARTLMRSFRDRASAEVTSARLVTEQGRAAKDALRLALPGIKNLRRRRIILARLWSGALAPAHLLALVAAHRASPTALVWAVLDAVGQGQSGPALVAQWADESGPESGPALGGPAGPMALEAAPPSGPEVVEASGPVALALPEDRGPETAPGEAGPPGASLRGRAAITNEDIEAAIKDGRINGRVSRAAIKAAFGITSNGTAGKVLQAWNEAQDRQAADETVEAELQTVS